MTTAKKQVRDLMNKNLVMLAQECSVSEAARHMKSSNVGGVLVKNGEDDLVGIVTDRDVVVRVLAMDKDPDKTTLKDVCSDRLTTLAPQDDLSKAVETMRERSIRRLPVVEDGHAVGVLSLGDLALELDPESALGRISAAPPNA